LTLWHIGNTTVRTPYRLKEALKALKNSEFHGNLLGKELEQDFAELLNERSIVKVERIEIGTKKTTQNFRFKLCQ
jgi:glutamine synthetase